MFVIDHEVANERRARSGTARHSAPGLTGTKGPNKNGRRPLTPLPFRPAGASSTLALPNERRRRMRRPCALQSHYKDRELRLHTVYPRVKRIDSAWSAGVASAPRRSSAPKGGGREMVQRRNQEAMPMSHRPLRRRLCRKLYAAPGRYGRKRALMPKSTMPPAGIEPAHAV